MKNFAKMIVAGLLAVMARGVVRRYQPRIMMVTGSVGKTSTKDAVATVLAVQFLVRKSEKSFNSEFGVPFTIFGAKDPSGNFFAWLGVFKKALSLLILPNHYPNMLVLEVGADKPRDIERILRIATPNAVIVTRLPEIPVHVEAYTSPAAVREEEFSPAYALAPGAPLILYADDPYALDASVRSSAHVISYGMANTSTVRISDTGFYEDAGKVLGMQMQVLAGGKEKSISVKGAVGLPQLLPVAAAIATAIAFDISPADAFKALESYEPPPGRCRLLAGIHNSTIIDDSYNSSPAAAEEALATLKVFPNAKRRVAILGDMLELGRYSTMEHERVGALAIGSADVIVAVGVRARAFISVPENAEILSFDNSAAAAAALPVLIKEGDVVLVKGSQSIRTERIVEALLANPSDVAYLARQGAEWRQRA